MPGKTHIKELSSEKSAKIFKIVSMAPVQMLPIGSNNLRKRLIKITKDYERKTNPDVADNLSLEAKLLFEFGLHLPCIGTRQSIYNATHS